MADLTRETGKDSRIKETLGLSDSNQSRYQYGCMEASISPEGTIEEGEVKPAGGPLTNTEHEKSTKYISLAQIRIYLHSSGLGPIHPNDDGSATTCPDDPSTAVGRKHAPTSCYEDLISSAHRIHCIFSNQHQSHVGHGARMSSNA